MRHIATPTRNVKAIVKQAEIDLKNGSISFADYSNILRRVSVNWIEFSICIELNFCFKLFLKSFCK